MKVEVNRASIFKKVKVSKGLIREARKQAKDVFEDAKEAYMKEFEKHKITKELEAGPNASNTSGTLGGYGNLFSFMGFNEGTDPVKPVENFLKSFISLKPQGKSRGNAKEYTVKVPSIEDFDFAKMPWEQGNSWVRAVEVGISGFSYYMHKAHEASRAGTGLQMNHKLRSVGSKTTPYMTELLSKFRKRLLR